MIRLNYDPSLVIVNTPSRNPRKILGSNASRFFTPSPSDPLATNTRANTDMSTSDSSSQQQQQPQLPNGYGPIMRPSTTSIGGFTDCWQIPNNNSNTVNSSSLWTNMPYGQFNGTAPESRMPPGLVATGNGMQQHPSLLSYGPPIAYYPSANGGNYNINYTGMAGGVASGSSTVSQQSYGAGQPCFDENTIRYPNMMAVGGHRNHSSCNDPTTNDHRSIGGGCESLGCAAASSSSGGGKENPTVQIKIQCINHTNPININSPSGLNNVANMSCHHADHNNINNNMFPNQTNDSHANNKLPITDRNLNEFPPLQVNHKYKLFEEKPSPTMSSLPKTRTDSSDSLTTDSDYEMMDVPMVSFAAATQALSSEITQLSLRGCDLAERLAHNHRNRPCFKKIDSLCARTKQDLARQDSVLANINSQGTAWAVKDFIFVFTRIINAWIIIKGYANNAPEGLLKLKAGVHPEFDESFNKWQESTRDFIDILIKSFSSLEQMVQTQRASYQKFDAASSSSVGAASMATANKQNEHTIGQHSPTAATRKTFTNGKMDADLPIDESLSYMMKLFSFDAESNAGDSPMSAMMADHSSTLAAGLSDQSSAVAYLSNVVEESEETQRQAMEKGTYFKTGLYNPLLKKELTLPANNEPKSIFTQSAISTASATLINRYVANGNPGTADVGIIQSMEPKWNAPMHPPNCNSLDKTAFSINDVFLYQKLMAEAHKNASYLQFQQQQQIQYKSQEQNLSYMMPIQPTQNIVQSSIPQYSLFKAASTKEQPGVSDHSERQVNPSKNNGGNPVNTMGNMAYLVAKVCSIKECKYFFTSAQMKNYFPDFETIVPNYRDICTIMLRSNIGAYASLNELVHDLRQIVYSGRKYLKHRTTNLAMTSAVKAFDIELESILRESVFSEYDFSEITGISEHESKMLMQDNFFCKTNVDY